MKKSIAVILAFLSSPLQAAITLIQHPDSICNSGNQSMTVTALGLHHLVVVVTGSYGGLSGHTSTVTDNSVGGSNFYQHVVSAPDSNQPSQIEIWYSTTTVSGATTVSETNTDSSSCIEVLEYSGTLISSLSPVDVSNHLDSQAAASPVVGPNLTITNSGDVLIEADTTSGITSVSSPWINEDAANFLAADYLPGTTGTYHVTWNVSASATSGTAGAAFFPDSKTIPQRMRQGSGL
jgi:hypothetical protein